jgi:hypothetical protein
LGLSFGVGIPLQANPTPEYFLGASLYLGAEQQLNISAGAVVTQINVLNDSIYPNPATVFAKQPAQIPYISQLKFGMFVSLTYTIYTFGNHKNSGSQPPKNNAPTSTSSKPAPATPTQQNNVYNYNGANTAPSQGKPNGTTPPVQGTPNNNSTGGP